MKANLTGLLELNGALRAVGEKLEIVSNTWVQHARTLEP